MNLRKISDFIDKILIIIAYTKIVQDIQSLNIEKRMSYEICLCAADPP